MSKVYIYKVSKDIYFTHAILKTPVYKSGQPTIFRPFFVRYFADWPAPSPIVRIIPIPPSEFYFPIHELILLMSGQCANTGSSFPCPFCLRQYIKSRYSYYCSSCRSWMRLQDNSSKVNSPTDNSPKKIKLEKLNLTVLT